ncbi:hypothetical protein [Streptomyces platensis]
MNAALAPADLAVAAASVRRRDDAGPERLARAEQAKLTHRTKCAVMMRPGA